MPYPIGTNVHVNNYCGIIIAVILHDYYLDTSTGKVSLISLKTPKYLVRLDLSVELGENKDWWFSQTRKNPAAQVNITDAHIHNGYADFWRLPDEFDVLEQQLIVTETCTFTPSVTGKVISKDTIYARQLRSNAAPSKHGRQSATTYLTAKQYYSARTELLTTTRANSGNYGTYRLHTLILHDALTSYYAIAHYHYGFSRPLIESKARNKALYYARCGICWGIHDLALRVPIKQMAPALHLTPTQYRSMIARAADIRIDGCTKEGLLSYNQYAPQFDKYVKNIESINEIIKSKYALL